MICSTYRGFDLSRLTLLAVEFCFLMFPRVAKCPIGHIKNGSNGKTAKAICYFLKQIPKKQKGIFTRFFYKKLSSSSDSSYFLPHSRSNNILKVS